MSWWPWGRGEPTPEPPKPKPKPRKKELPMSIQLLHDIARQKLKTSAGIGKVALYASSFCRDTLRRDTYSDKILMPRHLVEIMQWTLKAAADELLEKPSESSSPNS